MGAFKKKLAVLALILPALAFAPLTGGKASAAENAAYTQPPVINVQLPMNLNFTIDPFEVNGRGQIYSDEHVIRNIGETNVIVDFADIYLTYADTAEMEPLPYPVDENWRTDRKSIYMSLDFERYYLPPIVLTDPNNPWYLSAALDAPDGFEEDRSRLAFSFSGSVNAAPASEWKKGDVKVTLVYSIKAEYPEGYYNQQQPTPTPAPLISTPAPTPLISAPTATPAAPEPTATPVIPEPTPVMPVPTEPPREQGATPSQQMPEPEATPEPLPGEAPGETDTQPDAPPEGTGPQGEITGQEGTGGSDEPVPPAEPGAQGPVEQDVQPDGAESGGSEAGQ